jgi:putative ABC transport system substrate-binding protein
MKKVIALMLALVLVLSVCALTSCSDEDDKYKIGICQLVQHDALDAATDGFKQAVIDQLGEENVEFDTQNAAGESTACTTICNQFVSNGVDLIMANATAALQAAYNATETIPILGTSITEYGVALGIDDFTGTVGSNVSGTSDLANLEQQAQMILDLVPSATKVGILYCSAEPNSAYQVSKVKAYLEARDITVTEYPFADSNEVSAVATTAAANSDALYVPTDNTAAACAETIGNVVRDARVPLIAGEKGICTGCGIATLSISYYDLGYTTGLMAAKILKGEEKIEEMAVEYAPAIKMYNKDMCEELGITIPDGYTEIE